MTRTGDDHQTQGQVPSAHVGRVIGRGGAIVQELQSLTGCRVTVAKRRGGGDEECGGGEALVSVSIRCVAGAARDRQASEARCWRAVQLMCSEALSLEAALAQADAELKEHAAFEAVRAELHEFEMAVRRIRIDWGDFAEADIAGALREGENDEDRAVEMLLAGYRAPSAEAMPRKQSKSVPSATAAPKEEFPALAETSSGVGLRCHGRWAVAAPSRWCPSAAEMGSADAFPGLPAPRPASGLPSRGQVTCARRTSWTTAGQRGQATRTRCARR